MVSRRRVLLTGAGFVGLAGCSSLDDDGTPTGSSTPPGTTPPTATPTPTRGTRTPTETPTEPPEPTEEVDV